MAEANKGSNPPQAIIKLSANCDIRCTVFTTNMALSLLFTKSRTDFVEWLLQTWISVSSEKRTSDKSLWCMYDHLNSGILNGGLVGPGLNIGLDELELGFAYLLPTMIERECNTQGFLERVQWNFQFDWFLIYIIFCYVGIFLVCVRVISIYQVSWHGLNGKELFPFY